MTDFRGFLFHIDVGAEEGWGHLTESLMIADELTALGHACAFIVAETASEAIQAIETQGFSVARKLTAEEQRSPNIARIAELITCPETHLVSNLVTIHPEYAAMIPDRDRWSVITEHTAHEVAGTNFNISREPRWMPLAPLYQNAAAKTIRESLQECLVCFGGSDPKNITGYVLEMLRQAVIWNWLPNNFSVTAVKGPLYAYGSMLQAAASAYPLKLNIEGPVSAERMKALAEQSDLAITTGGGTMYEYCALGVPSIIIPVLEKMDANARVLEAQNAVVRTAMAHELSAHDLALTIQTLLPFKARQTLSTDAQSAVDGLGARRIAQKLATQSTKVTIG